MTSVYDAGWSSVNLPTKGATISTTPNTASIHQFPYRIADCSFLSHLTCYPAHTQHSAGPPEEPENPSPGGSRCDCNPIRSTTLRRIEIAPRASYPVPEEAYRVPHRTDRKGHASNLGKQKGRGHRLMSRDKAARRPWPPRWTRQWNRVSVNSVSFRASRADGYFWQFLDGVTHG